jgi:large subunit ribosomal protein L20
MRTTNAVARHKSKKQTMKAARGFYGARHRQLKKALEATRRAEAEAFRGRKQKKRDFRSLWITRINIAARDNGITYSQLIAGLHKANIELDRKQLSELAIHQPQAFTQVCEAAKGAMAG